MMCLEVVHTQICQRVTFLFLTMVPFYLEIAAKVNQRVNQQFHLTEKRK